MVKEFVKTELDKALRKHAITKDDYFLGKIVSYCQILEKIKKSE